MIFNKSHIFIFIYTGIQKNLFSVRDEKNFIRRFEMKQGAIWEFGFIVFKEKAAQLVFESYCVSCRIKKDLIGFCQSHLGCGVVAVGLVVFFEGH